jgi:hypothetical protein
LLGASKVLGKTILEFFDTNRAHKMILQCSYGSYFRSKVQTLAGCRLQTDFFINFLLPLYLTTGYLFEYYAGTIGVAAEKIAGALISQGGF